MKSNPIGVRLYFGSDNFCPVCEKVFKHENDKVSMTLRGNHVGYVHSHCEEFFNDLLLRISEVSEAHEK